MTVRGHIRNGVAVPDEPDTLPEGAEVQIQLVPSTSPTAVDRRGGQWRGQVQIAPDFDLLPDDFADAFGLRAP